MKEKPYNHSKEGMLPEEYISFKDFAESVLQPSDIHIKGAKGEVFLYDHKRKIVLSKDSEKGLCAYVNW